jgi:RNA polymerase primary sigma factor
VEHFDPDCELAYVLYKADSHAYRRILTHDEERELAIRIKAGDTDALNTLILHNLRLVTSIAKHFMGHGLTLLDLIQEGNIGLVRAARKFNPDRGRFSTCATWWVKQAVGRAVTERGPAIHLPAHAGQRISKVERIASQLATRQESEPTDEQIAVAARLTVAQVQQARHWHTTVRPPMSLDAPIDGRDEDLYLRDTLIDTRVPDVSQLCQNADLRIAIEQALAHLPEREQAVIRARYGLDDGSGATLKAVGEQFGVTRERIRQIEVKALRNLRPYLEKALQREEVSV